MENNEIKFCSDQPKRFEWSKTFVKTGDKVTFLTVNEFNKLNEILTSKYGGQTFWKTYLNDYSIYICTIGELINNTSKEYTVYKPGNAEEFLIEEDKSNFWFSADIIKWPPHYKQAALEGIAKYNKSCFSTKQLFVIHIFKNLALKI